MQFSDGSLLRRAVRVNLGLIKHINSLGEDWGGPLRKDNLVRAANVLQGKLAVSQPLDELERRNLLRFIEKWGILDVDS